MSEAQLKIAIVGATGVVGQVALDLFAARNWPADRLIAMASIRISLGTMKWAEPSNSTCS